jgi:hypothetical protein
MDIVDKHCGSHHVTIAQPCFTPADATSSLTATGGDHSPMILALVCALAREVILRGHGWPAQLATSLSGVRRFPV